MANVKLSSPWEIYYSQITKLFEKDNGVIPVLDDTEEEKVIKLFVDQQGKADALAKLLEPVKTFGNVVVKVKVLPSNTTEESPVELFRKAFEGNGALSYIASTSAPFEFNYVVFKKEVVQYYADNMSDPNGNHSTLYQNLANDIFEKHPGIYFATDVE